MLVGPTWGSYLLKQSGNKFRNIYRSIHNASGYCIFVYSTLGQVCWPWMTPCTIGSASHVQCRASWKKRFGILESPGIFFPSKIVGTLRRRVLTTDKIARKTVFRRHVLILLFLFFDVTALFVNCNRITHTVLCRRGGTCLCWKCQPQPFRCLPSCVVLVLLLPLYVTVHYRAVLATDFCLCCCVYT